MESSKLLHLVTVEANGADAVSLINTVAGMADHPVYLLITGERVGIRDGSSLWGKTVSQTDTLLRKAHGKDAQVLGIGPAGENRVRFAGVATEGPEFESMCAMGSNLGNDDLSSLVFLNRRLNDLGIDSISTGGVIAYAMECYQGGFSLNLSATRLTGRQRCGVIRE